MNVHTGDPTAQGAMVVARPRALECACMGDIAVHPLWGASIVVVGSPRLLVDGAPAARVGDVTASGDMVAVGDNRTVLQ